MNITCRLPLLSSLSALCWKKGVVIYYFIISLWQISQSSVFSEIYGNTAIFYHLISFAKARKDVHKAGYIKTLEKYC